MTKLLALGLNLSEVVATVTSRPAAMIRMDDEIGALRPGMQADISVLDLQRGRFELRDNSGESVISDALLMPVFALKAGRRFDADSPLIPPAVRLAA